MAAPAWVAKSLLTLALVLVVAAPTLAANDCVRFDGIRHCPVGSAELNLTSNGSHLVASNLGSSGEDGVASRFQGATHWEAEMSVVGQDRGDLISVLAISNGFLVSQATIILEDNAMISNGLFTGNPQGIYTLAVLNDGVLVSQIPGMDSQTQFSVVPGPDDGPFGGPFGGPNGPIIDWPPEGDWPPDWDFDNGPFGACIWGLSFSGDVTVLAQGQQVVGDEIRMIESVGGPGGYNYLTFDSIVTLGNGSGIAIESETVLTQ